MQPESEWLSFINDGGPLLVLPREAAPHWEGGDIPSGGRVVEAKFRYDSEIATDYDRACDVEELAELIEVGPSWGLVLDDDIPSATWMRLPGDESFFVVRIYYANDDSDEQILKTYSTRTERDWKKVGSDLPVRNGDLVLMHAADRLNGSVTEKSPKDEGHAFIGHAIVYRTEPGNYDIDICDIELPEEAHFTFFRFTRCARDKSGCELLA